MLEDLNGAMMTVWDPYLYSGKFNTASRRGKVTVSGNDVYCSVDNFENYANYKHFWIYSNDNGNGNNYVPVQPSQPSGYSAGSYEVTASALRVRSGAGTNYRIVTKLYNGSRQGVDYTEGNWGHLMNDAGWICLDYCKKITATSTSQSSSPVRTITGYRTGTYRTTSNLHVRTGASTKYRAKTYRELTANARKQNRQLGNYYYNGYKKGVVCTVTKVNGNWGLTRSRMDLS